MSFKQNRLSCRDVFRTILQKSISESISCSVTSLAMAIHAVLTEPLEPAKVGMPWPSMDADFVVEIVEQPRSSEPVTLKRLSESQADVEDAMRRLESLVLQATESALKESTGMVKHLLMDRPELPHIPQVAAMPIPPVPIVELPVRSLPQPLQPEISKGERNHLDPDMDKDLALVAEDT